jgi:hypothetical protein
MNIKYLEAIETASTILADAIVSDMEEALSYGAGLDRTVQDLTYAIGSLCANDGWDDFWQWLHHERYQQMAA